MASPAVIVEVISSTDPVGFVDPFGTFTGKCENDCLAPDGCIEGCDDMIEVVSLGKHELGGRRGASGCWERFCYRYYDPWGAQPEW